MLYNVVLVSAVETSAPNLVWSFPTRYQRLKQTLLHFHLCMSYVSWVNYLATFIINNLLCSRAICYKCPNSLLSPLKFLDDSIYCLLSLALEGAPCEPGPFIPATSPLHPHLPARHTSAPCTATDRPPSPCPLAHPAGPSLCPSLPQQAGPANLLLPPGPSARLHLSPPLHLARQPISFFPPSSKN